MNLSYKNDFYYDEHNSRQKFFNKNGMWMYCKLNGTCPFKLRSKFLIDDLTQFARKLKLEKLLS